MKCDCCEGCDQQASVTIWCPTWVTAYKGPIHRSPDHAKVFTPANPESIGKAFYFEDEAHEMFAKCETFIQREDSRYQSTLNMLHNGQYIMGRALGKNSSGSFTKSLFHQSLHVVDGKLWLATHYHLCGLGNWPEDREIWQKLLVQVASDR